MPAIYILNYPTLQIPDHGCVVCTAFECKGPPNTEMKYFVAKILGEMIYSFHPSYCDETRGFSVRCLVLLLGQCFIWHKRDYITVYCKTV